MTSEKGGFFLSGFNCTLSSVKGEQREREREGRGGEREREKEREREREIEIEIFLTDQFQI